MHDNSVSQGFNTVEYSNKVLRETVYLDASLDSTNPSNSFDSRRVSTNISVGIYIMRPIYFGSLSVILILF